MAEFVWDRLGLDDLDREVGKHVTKLSIRVHRRAKQLAPVDTGRLRSSVTYEVDKDAQGWVGVIGTDVEYGPYIEFGTRRMRAQPFLRPALDTIRTGP